MMYAAFDAIPRFCPQCGAAFNWDRQPSYAALDYYAHASHICPKGCGLEYQYIEETQLLTAAREAGGDLGKF